MDPITRFLDLRRLWGGGDVADKVQLKQWTGGDDYADQTKYVNLLPSDFEGFTHGRDVLIATHGFNVNRADGIQTLSMWSHLLTLPGSAVFVGLLWPGDSESLHALSYPVEPRTAMDAGNLLASFLDANLQNAASISLVSHSLGARVVLQTTSQMKLPVRRLILMAGAIGDDCLTSEYKDVPAEVDVISVLASKEDEVLRWAFPIGDLASDFVDDDHPWWESALGRFGPRNRPQHYLPPCEIPKDWKYGHSRYLQTDPPAAGPFPPECSIPPPDPLPQGGPPGWQEAWSAALVSCRFK
jgi:pimeloyl-ACP methyl ester carboxylesterase